MTSATDVPDSACPKKRVISSLEKIFLPGRKAAIESDGKSESPGFPDGSRSWEHFIFYLASTSFHLSVRNTEAGSPSLFTRFAPVGLAAQA